MTPSHTPIPWFIQRKENGKANIIFNQTIVVRNIRIENAEFIIRACNAHDDLVAALKNIKSEAEGQIESGGNCYRYIIELTIEALAKAKGEIK